jgi:hypothetical protein
LDDGIAATADCQHDKPTSYSHSWRKHIEVEPSLVAMDNPLVSYCIGQKLIQGTKVAVDQQGEPSEIGA